MITEVMITKIIFLAVFGGLELGIIIDLIESKFYGGEPIHMALNAGLQLFCIAVIIFVAVFR